MAPLVHRESRAHVYVSASAFAFVGSLQVNRLRRSKAFRRGVLHVVRSLGVAVITGGMLDLSAVGSGITTGVVGGREEVDVVAVLAAFVGVAVTGVLTRRRSHRCSAPPR